MSSALPPPQLRRVTKVPRTTSVKENENAGARPSRLLTRLKPPSAGLTSTGAGTTSGVSRPTAASLAKSNIPVDGKADPQSVKRKREALGEVIVAGNKPLLAGAKGKGKEVFDGVIVKPKLAAVRQPLRTVSTTKQSAPAPESKKPSSKVSILKEEKLVAPAISSKDDHAMAIDHPRPPPAFPALTIRRSELIKETKVASQATRPSHLHPSLARSLIARRQEVEEVEEPVHKKRRTSSVPPEESPEALEDAHFREEEKLREARIAAEMEAFANEEEADPDTSPWDDLDADDAEDPLMVSEYVQDIFLYMKRLELTTMPNPNYMENQKELAWQMRGILTDWLIQVHMRFRLLPETLFLAVNIIDRFLSARVVSLAKLQLVGVTCMFMAAKFEEIMAPSISNFLMCADSSYTETQILQAERYVLRTLDWNMSYPNPVHYLRRISKADDYNIKVRTLAKYLLEIGVVEWRLIAAPPSLLAAASIWLARLALGMEQWTPNLAHYSSYKESSIIPTANLMLNYILKPIRHESFFDKYAGKRFYKSSVYMRQWALDRWDEGTTVDLSKVIHRLKAEIKVNRETEAQELLDEDREI